MRTHGENDACETDAAKCFGVFDGQAMIRGVDGDLEMLHVDGLAMIRAALDGSVMLRETVGDLVMTRDCSDEPPGIGGFSDVMEKDHEVLCGSVKLVGVWSEAATICVISHGLTMILVIFHDPTMIHVTFGGLEKIRGVFDDPGTIRVVLSGQGKLHVALVSLAMFRVVSGELLELFRELVMICGVFDDSEMLCAVCDEPVILREVFDELGKVHELLCGSAIFVSKEMLHVVFGATGKVLESSDDPAMIRGVLDDPLKFQEAFDALARVLGLLIVPWNFLEPLLSLAMSL